MPRPPRLPRPAVLVALVAGLVAGSCGGTLYDADGVPVLDTGVCSGTTRLCPGIIGCVGQDNFTCGDTCKRCDAVVNNGQPACLQQPGGAFDCGITCDANFRACGSQCLAQLPTSCGAACTDCTAAGPIANGAHTCADQGGAVFACDYACDAGFFKANGACVRPAAVAAGQRHTCAVLDGGALACWGDNGGRQLGPNAAGATSVVPRVVIASQVAAVAGGARHTCAVVGADRHVECWGANDLGQLGRGSTGATPSATPAPVVPVGGALTGVIQLAAGANHTCALTGAGAVRCWGANASGQSGTNTATTFVAQPGTAAILAGATALAAGGGTTCATTAAGLLCWGANTSGQTGRGSTAAALTPAPVTGLPAGGTISAFAVGTAHACANTGATTGLWCWGDNAFWQLGNGDPAAPPAASSAVPVQSSALDNRTRFDGLVLAGGVFTCAGRAPTQETTLKCGGLADDLPIGIPAVAPGVGNLVDANDVIPGGVLVSVTAGLSHACALVDVGALGAPLLQVKCWGRNAEGQLGRTTLDPARDGAPGIAPQ